MRCFSRATARVPSGFVIAAACCLAAAVCGCTGRRSIHPQTAAVAGYPQHGRQLIERYKCGQCHTIPGVPHARGVFGPPLNFMGQRTMLAGNFPNTETNLIRWIRSPQSMKPGTAMPALGLDERQARDVAAYLETLRSAP